MSWDHQNWNAPGNRRKFGIARKHHNRGKIGDYRKQIGEDLEPFAYFDPVAERFCCRRCPYKGQTYRGIQAHLVTEHE